MSFPASPIPIDQLLAQREWVRRVARAMVRDENDADDLEQGMWLSALQHPPRSERSLRGWLFTALRRDWANARHSEDCRSRREETTARSEAIPSAEELIAKADAHKRVVDAVMALEEPYRSTILYRFFEDLPPSVIAERQGIPVETVRTRVRRALAQLRERFDAESGGDRSAWTLGLVPLMHGRDLAARFGTSTAAKVAGGVAMKAKTTKLTLAALLLLLGGVGGWMIADGAAARVRSTPEVATASGRGAVSADASAVASDEDVAATPTVERPSSPATAARTTGAVPNPPEKAGGAKLSAAPAVAVATATPPAPPVIGPDFPDGPPGPGEVVGRVSLEPGRKPVGGALVSLDGVRGERSVVTGRNGVYRIAVGGGEATLRASLDGHAPREIRVKVPATGSGVGGADFVFGDGGTIEGQVAGRDGAVADAEISINAGRGGFAQATTRTDGDGRYRIEDVPAGGLAWVGLRVGGVLRTRYANVVARTVTRLDFDLGKHVPQASLAGLVTDRGFPLMGIVVRVEPAAPRWTMLDAVVADCTTKDTGAYSIEGLPAGQFTVAIERYVDGRGQTSVVKTLTLSPGDNRLDITLGEGDFAGEVSGRVVSKVDGSPVDRTVRVYALEERAPGAWVARSPSAFATGSSVQNGAYRFRGLPPGRYRLDVGPDAAVDFDLAYGETKKVDVQVGPPKPREKAPDVATLSGRLTDAAGTPVARGMIDVFAADTDCRSRGFTDNSGRYSVDSSGPGPLLPGACRVFYTGIDSDCEAGETTIVAGPNALDLRLAAGEATGRVYARADGRGLGQLDVTLTANAVLPDGSLRTVGVARAQPDGTFRFVGLRDGTLRLVAWPRVDGLRPVTADVEIVAGHRVSGVELPLDAAQTGTAVVVVHDDAGGDVRWIVLESLADGRPVPGSRAKLYSVTSTFAVPVTAGPWTLALWTEDGRLAATANGEVAAGAAVRADVVLRPRKSEGERR